MNLWLFPGMSSPTDVEVTSDAAGSLGFGAYYNSECAWMPSQADRSIAYKELFPVVVASHVWGPQWSGRHILFQCDNEAVVHILIARTSTVPCITCLLCHLLSAAARFNFTFTSQHIPGIHNNMLMLFRALVGRNSGGWCPRHSFTRCQSFLNSGSS